MKTLTASAARRASGSVSATTTPMIWPMQVTMEEAKTCVESPHKPLNLGNPIGRATKRGKGKI